LETSIYVVGNCLPREDKEDSVVRVDATNVAKVPHEGNSAASGSDNIGKAEETFHASINNNPDDAARQEILIKYIRTKRGNDEAIKELKGLIVKYSELGSLRTALGELYVLGGDMQSAIEPIYQGVTMQ